MLARRLSQSSSEQTLPEVVYIFQCCNNLQDIQYDHAGIRLVASLVKLPLTISDAFVSRIDYRNSDAASQLLAEGIDVQEERADLHKRIKRIGEAKELLGKFGKA